MTGRGKAAMIVLDSEGEPIRLDPPTFDDGTWTQLQKAATLRKLGQRTPSKTANPVLGIAVCGHTGCPSCGGLAAAEICGSSLAQQITRRNLAKRRSKGVASVPVRSNSIELQRCFGSW